jgi:type III restriction enzyme
MSVSHVKSISARLSLRLPQRKSLEILDEVMECMQLSKGGDVNSALNKLRSKFPDVESFERNFPNLCFSLATGVGKTRLMGAFITYLFTKHKIRHFFIVAPNLTIYNKLLADFTPNTPKYVFQGVAEFAVKPPTLKTGDNFEQRSVFEGEDDLVINIFNISKFNTSNPKSRRVHEFHEARGQSYFNYLAGFEDLVILMDEAHRYRAETSMTSIENLQPLLGLELTATPQVERGGTSVRFKNVIYNYPLSNAMRDGFVKEPAVATRKDFNPQAMSSEALELLKLEDGVRIHEDVKVALEVYAHENGVRRVKPFMLVIAQSIEHAKEIKAKVEDEGFFHGRYKERVTLVHSKHTDAEQDEIVQELLKIESIDNRTEIVIHVTMLKEGWDVTNLYTIVPLRTANSLTLVEQSIGRGLRLPYGKRTGVPAVDRLTIVSHDRFQEIVDAAKAGNYSFSTIKIGEDIDENPQRTFIVAPKFEALLGVSAEVYETEETQYQDRLKNHSGLVNQDLASTIRTALPVEIAKAALKAINAAVHEPGLVTSSEALQSPKVQQYLLNHITEEGSARNAGIIDQLSDDKLAIALKNVAKIYAEHTIAIPRIIVLPTGDVRAGFRDFKLDLSTLRFQPIAQEIIVQHLNSEVREVLGAKSEGVTEVRLEDYVVRGLIDFDDVNYDEQANLLYNLAGQVVEHLRGYLKDDGEVLNVLMFHHRKISALVHAQMQNHAWEKASSYEVIVNRGFSEVRSQAFAAPMNEQFRAYDMPIDNPVDIRKMLFVGFRKSLYPVQKFESDPERRFAVLLEREEAVIKWFKPGRGVFQIRYAADSNYEPDFVVETKNEKLICEPKRADQMSDSTVLAKARAAAVWCKNATVHERAHNGKPWRYMLIPHDSIAENMTLDGLSKQYTFIAQE